jgi:hypothetical protein
LKEKLNLKALEKAISKEPIQLGEIDGKKIIFNPNISFEKIFIAGEKISDSILKADGSYRPELKGILIFCFIIQNMTNIPIKRDKDGTLDMDFIYTLMCSEIGENITNQIVTYPVYNFLYDKVEQTLDFKKEVYFRKISSQDKVLENLDGIISEVKNAVQKILSFTDEHKNLISSGTLNKMIETLDKFKSK